MTSTPRERCKHGGLQMHCTEFHEVEKNDAPERIMGVDFGYTKAPEWKERFDNTFDFVRSEMGEFEQIHYDNLKKFIAQEKALSYEEGKQRGLIEIDTTETDSTYDEGKKVGFKAGIAKAIEEVRKMKYIDLSDLLTTLEKLDL